MSETLGCGHPDKNRACGDCLDEAEAEVQRLELQLREMTEAYEKQKKHNGAMEIAVQEAHRDADDMKISEAGWRRTAEKAEADLEESNRLNGELDLRLNRINQQVCEIPCYCKKGEGGQHIQCKRCRAMEIYEEETETEKRFCDVEVNCPGGVCMKPLPCPNHG